MMYLRGWRLLGLMLLVLLTACARQPKPDENSAVTQISQYENISGVAYAASFRLMRVEQPYDGSYTLFYDYEVRAADSYQNAVLKIVHRIDSDRDSYYPPRLRGQVAAYLRQQGVALLTEPLPAAFRDYLQQEGKTSYQERLEHLQLAVYAARAYGFLPDTAKGETLEERNARILFRHSQVYGWVSRMD